MQIGHEVMGNGPEKIIVLHGWLSDREVYNGIMPFMDHDNFTWAFMDFRGYGRSANIAGSYSIDEIATDAIALADMLGWQQFHIVGHSMGGMAAQKIALMVPDRVKSIVAVAPVPASGFQLDAGGAAFFKSSATDDDALAAIYNTLTGEQHTRTILNTLVARTRAATQNDAYLGYLETWTHTDFSQSASEITCPVRVIAGAHDGALGPGAMEETYLKQLSNVSMEVINGAGHYPMLETPLELVRRVETFLAQHA